MLQPVFVRSVGASLLIGIELQIERGVVGTLNRSFGPTE
jgi:hypothetical protein